MNATQYPIRYITHEQWGGDMDGIGKDGKQVVFTVQRGDGYGIITAHDDNEKEIIEAMPAFGRGMLTILSDETVQTGKGETLFNQMFTAAELRMIKQLPKEAKDTIKENILDICKAHFGEDIGRVEKEAAVEPPEGNVSEKGYPTATALKKMGIDELKGHYMSAQLEGFDNPEMLKEGEINLPKNELVKRLDAHYRKIEKTQF